MGIQLPSPKGHSPSPIFGPCLLWPNGWVHQDASSYEGRPQPKRLCVRWGPSPPLQKGGKATPNFRSFVCDQTAGCIKMPLIMEVGLSLGGFVLDGNPVPSPKRGRSPKFSAHIYCGQTAGWIKMPLCTEAGLDPGDIVLEGDPAPTKRDSPPIFGPCLLWPNGCMYTTWYGGKPRPRRHCVRWEPSSPSPKGAQPPIFGQCPLWPNGWMN